MLATLLLSSSLLAATPLQDVDPGQDEDLGTRLDTYLRRLEPLGFSGAVVVLVGDDVVLEETYGLAVPSAGTPFGPTSGLPIGSISKHFTAAAVMRLDMDARLSVDDTLGDLLGEGFDVPADKAEITVHQLLTHTSGLPSSAGAAGSIPSADALVRAALAVDLVFEPGDGQAYSNLGYGLLAALVERAAGEPFERYLRDEVLVPSGMTHTGITEPGWAGEAAVHGIIDGREGGPLDADWSGSPWSLLGAGGIRTTLGDMVRWERACRDETVLDADALDLMTTEHVRSPGGWATGYGCGVFTTSRGTTQIGHDGSNDVFAADWRRYVDEDVMIFAATNDADLYALDVTPHLARIVFGREVRLPPELLKWGSGELEPYGGTYELAGGGKIRVQPNRRGVVCSTDDLEAAKLLHPVGRHQRGRRERLLGELPAAFVTARDGEFEDLRQLLDPYTPLEEFEARYARILESSRERHGPFVSADAVPGRNRFGEIAIVVRLVHERGSVLIEYSFGPREVGSVRFLDELPGRTLAPADPTRFLDYDLETGETWEVAFALNSRGEPEALLLSQPGEEPVSARRVTGR